PVMKHMPGHGRAIADSHHNLPRVSAPANDLRGSDFAAFAALRDLPMGMTSHIVYGALDNAPATASARMIGLIRDEIGFDGLLMTDDISMNALSGTLAQRSAAAIAAGCDVVLYCHGDMAEMEAIVPAAGRMSAAAVERGARALALRHASTLDLAQARAEFDALIA
ncbi:MAG: glycoside hydrolase family 3 N-terminal domain-containing protein, partial [Paracoccus sp. (in: a-proteobacteria)]|nr:glycoside hydrolase family 3 N-terminal domain-containing protein [Paracoccus sp. (in: a-proteobacteria)]